MEIALGKYQIINSNSPKAPWNKKDKRTFIGILSLLPIGIGIASTPWIDNYLPKEIQYFVSIGLPTLLTFILFFIIENRRPFIYTNQDLYFYSQKLLIKSDTKKEIQIKELDSINFSYSGEDGGFFHPILNPNRNRGNMNILSLDLGTEIIRLELYLPKTSDKIRMDNILKKYREIISLNK